MKADPGAALSKAIESSSQADADTALRSLVAKHPTTWRKTLQRLAALPDPAQSSLSPSAFRERTRILASAGATLHAGGALDRQDLRWLDTLGIEMPLASLTFTDLKNLLRTLTFFEDSLATQTFRLGVLIENQHRSGRRLVLERGLVDGKYHPYAILDESIPTPSGGKASILGAYEALVESVELVLRYSHHLRNDASYGTLAARDPFGDLDLRRSLVAAGIWKTAVDELGAVKFGGWTTHSGDDHVCFAPPDLSEHLRAEIGLLREQAIQAQFFPQQVLWRAHSDTLEAIEELARSLVIPSAGLPWDGKFSKAALRAAVSDTVNEDMAAQWADFRHYVQYADSVRIPPTDLPWRTWIRAMSRLQVFAKALATAAWPDLTAVPKDTRAMVVVAHAASIVSMLEESGISRPDAQAAVDALTFSAKRRSLELWDQPILPLGSGQVLLVPGLITNGSPVRMLENAIAEWGEKVSGMRGIPFERHMADDIQALGFGQVRGNVSFADASGDDVQCDIVWWWNGFLIVFEAKCLKSSFSHAELAGARQGIEEAFAQLRRRRAAIRERWTEFRARFAVDGLPVACPPDDFIVTVVLTNILYFTGWDSADGIVVDDVAFRRYFGEADIAVSLVGKDGPARKIGTIGAIRNEEPSPSGFRAYLKAPPQCTFIQARMSVEIVRSPTSRYEFDVWSTNVAYEPDLTMPLETLEGGTPPQPA